ncbi:MAG: hypothetical protein H7Z71_10410 [Moraxellaceae bacterium]|nr:hypothetical protein [Pseudobdellovibrionaceae bacterium]
MKIIFAILLAQTLASGMAQAQTAKKTTPIATSLKKTCERLQKQADDECEESMDAECREQNYGEDCEHDGDFWEGHGICAFDTLADLISDYNKRNPKKKIDCDDVL